jgi:guanine deaminase
MKVIKTNVLNPVDKFQIEYLPEVYLSVEGTKIKSIETVMPENIPYEDHTDSVCLPGLIDAHTHLSQFYVRGKHSHDLLQWLNDHIFLEELRSSKIEYARKLSEDFFEALFRVGTTTAVIYTAPFYSACDIAFETAKKLGARSLIGMTMMDTNSPRELSQDTDKAIEESIRLCENWHDKNGLLQYIFSPRFAPVCSAKLMREISDYAKSNEIFIQTHLSENLDEIKWVKSLFPDCANYTEVYEKYGLLTDKTLLAHVIHISDEELQLIQNHDSRVIHCPDSNFFLKSGAFLSKKFIDNDMKLALASDVGAGTTLSMFNVMKMSLYRQETDQIIPETAFYYSTLGAALALDKEECIGSIESGKQADFILMPIEDIAHKTGEDILSNLIYLWQEHPISATYIAGKCVYEK